MRIGLVPLPEVRQSGAVTLGQVWKRAPSARNVCFQTVHEFLREDNAPRVLELAAASVGHMAIRIIAPILRRADCCMEVVLFCHNEYCFFINVRAIYSGPTCLDRMSTMSSDGMRYENPRVAKLLIAIGVGAPAVLVAFMVFNVHPFWLVFLIPVPFAVVVAVWVTVSSLMPGLLTGAIPTGPGRTIVRSTQPIRYWLMIVFYVLIIGSCGIYIWVPLTVAYRQMF